MKKGGFRFQPNHVPFAMGPIFFGPHASELLDFGEVTAALVRHTLGDWGEVDHQARFADQRALRERTLVSSKYRTADNREFWVTTDLDRRRTTVLVDEDVSL